MDANGWILVSEELPNDARDVLVWDAGDVYKDYYCNETQEWIVGQPSHWREMLPDPVEPTP